MTDYTLSEIAEAELDDILQSIAERDGVDRALHVHAKFVDAFESLATSPSIGVVKLHLTTTNVRWWPVFSYLVAYDAEAQPLAILRIIHGARDLPKLFQHQI